MQNQTDNSVNLKERIKSETVAAMRNKDKERLAAIRLLSAAIKQSEVDNKKDLDDAGVLGIIDKMLSQRKDSFNQFMQADRQDLAVKEEFEMSVLQEFLPPQLSEQEVRDLINEGIKSVSASSMRDMGKVMSLLKPQLQGRTDLAAVSKTVKELLS